MLLMGLWERPPKTTIAPSRATLAAWSLSWLIVQLVSIAMVSWNNEIMKIPHKFGKYALNVYPTHPGNSSDPLSITKMLIWTWKKVPQVIAYDDVQMQVQLLKGAFLRHWCQCHHDVVIVVATTLLIWGRDLMKRSHRLPLVVGQHQSPAGGVPAEDHLHHRHWHLHSGLCAHFQLFHAHHCHFQYYRHGQQENDEILTFLFQNNIEELSPCHRQTQPVLTHLQETWQ